MGWGAQVRRIAADAGGWRESTRRASGMRGTANRTSTIRREAGKGKRVEDAKRAPTVSDTRPQRRLRPALGAHFFDRAMVSIPDRPGAMVEMRDQGRFAFLGGASGPIDRAGPMRRASIFRYSLSQVAPPSVERSAVQEKRSGRMSW